MFGSLFKKTPPSLEEQLALLVACGIELDEGTTPAALLAEWSADDYAADPYRLLLITLGGEHGWAHNIWHLDTECIEGEGDYVRIAKRMSAMAGDDLVLAEIEDVIDIDAGEARLSFVLDGEQYEWECEVKDDWVDPTVLSELAALLASQNSGRRFVSLDLKGQDCLLGCLSKEELARLRKTTGLDFVWLE